MIKLLTPWIGDLPPWHRQLRARMEASRPLVDWRLIQLPSWSSFRARCHDRLGIMPARNPDPRKLCDFRPAFGVLFPDLIDDAGWWGWADADCVFGDFAHFLTVDRLCEDHLITDHASIVNGPFTIMRAGELMDTLFMDQTAWVEILESPEYLNFDETGRPSGADAPLAAGGITALVRADGRINALFLDAHEHDRKHPAPRHTPTALYSGEDGREILTYHFTAGKQWPLS